VDRAGPDDHEQAVVLAAQDGLHGGALSGYVRSFGLAHRQLDVEFARRGQQVFARDMEV
jgi:hypothetical protein